MLIKPDIEKEVKNAQAELDRAEKFKETLDKTNLKFLEKNKYVNIERAMKIDSRFDGHIVQGHVECVAEISNLFRDTESLTISLNIPNNLLEYCIYKGSIAVNGVSLTIAKINKNIVDVCLIPHTLENTTFNSYKVGDLVNIETDIIAKYIKRLSSKRKIFEK